MKTNTFGQNRIWLPLLAGILVLSFARVVAATDTDAKRLETDLDNLKSAAGVSDVQFMDIPLQAPFVSCYIAVEGYKAGKVVFDSATFSKSSYSSDPPSQAAIVKVCVCCRPEKPALYERSSLSEKAKRVSGTGSTRLGFSFRVVEGGGRGGTGGEVVVPHAEFDLYNLRSIKCDGRPFTIVDRHHHERMTPVVVYLPKEFDVTTLKGDVDAVNLPDGTLVVYAAIKTAR